MILKTFEWEQLRLSIEKVNWDIRDLPSQPNVYVNELLDKLKQFNATKLDLVRRQLNCKLSKSIEKQLGVHFSRLTFCTLIDGFANSKKCSYSGRAAMRLDLQHLVTGISEAIAMRPLPDQDLAEQFITAYFYNETQLEELIRTRNRYTNRQIRAVIQCALADNRKSRTRLLSLLDSQSPDHSSG